MRRKVFDMLASVGGVVVVIVLVVAGSLLLVGYSFANNYVHTQLAEQQITFPSAAAFKHPVPGTEITPSMIPSVSQYAGQQLLTGQQAQVYANDFIKVHLNEIGGGKTYAQLSTAAMALPKGSAAYTAAEAKVQTVFQGTTLRGLLLEAYGFSLIASIASVVCDCGILPRRRHGGAGRSRLRPCQADGRQRGASSRPHFREDARDGVAPATFPVRSQHRPAKAGRCCASNLRFGSCVSRSQGGGGSRTSHTRDLRPPQALTHSWDIRHEGEGPSCLAMNCQRTLTVDNGLSWTSSWAEERVER